MTENIWQRSVDLMNRILKLTSGLALPRGDHWPTLVTASLSQANARLHSIGILLNESDEDSAVILTRSLFELAVNLEYISKDVSSRLPDYLRHGGFPTTGEEAEKPREKLRIGGQPQVKDIVPGQVWRFLKDMCCDLGSNWLAEYETFYRYASVPTHAGSFTLGKNYVQLLEQKPPSDHDRALVLATALVFHLRIASVAANVFPEQIKLGTVREMVSECQKLGQSL